MNSFWINSELVPVSVLHVHYKNHHIHHVEGNTMGIEKSLFFLTDLQNIIPLDCLIRSYDL